MSQFELLKTTIDFLGSEEINYMLVGSFVSRVVKRKKKNSSHAGARRFVNKLFIL